MTVEEEAAELLPCDIPAPHSHAMCPRDFRPAVAERLRQRDERNERDIREGAEVYIKSLDDRAKLRERIAVCEKRIVELEAELERAKSSEPN